MMRERFLKTRSAISCIPFSVPWNSGLCLWRWWSSPPPRAFSRLQELRISVPCRSAAVLLCQQPAVERMYSFLHIPSSSLRNKCFTLLQKFLLMFPRQLKSLRPAQRLVTNALVTVKLLWNWVLSHTPKHWPVNNTDWEHSSVYSKASEKLLRLWLRESSRGRSV